VRNQLLRAALAYPGAEDGHRLDAQLAAGADHAQRNFAAIGNKNAFEHRPITPGARPW